MNHYRAPLFEALLQLQKNHLSFHVPGHKDGSDFDIQGKKIFETLLSIDQTELEGLDDLHHADSVIAEAESLAADAFGSEETKFLVGGTTAGILAVILATIGPGERLLIQRNSHKSMFNGIALANGEPVFVYPKIDHESGIPVGVDPREIEEILKNDKSIRAVFLTSPNYYGFTSNLQEISAIVHSYDLPLFVDEAHGAHFTFHEELPRTALQQGADVVVQSTHKTLPAMTMASMIHFQGNRVNREMVKQTLAMLQSSSPSYPIMASLDLARRHMMVGEGKERLAQTIESTKELRKKLQSLPWLKVVPNHDPLRLVIQLSNGNSQALQKHLQDKGIYAEIVEPNRMVFVLTGGNCSFDLERLWIALSSFSAKASVQWEDSPVLIPDELWKLAPERGFLRTREMAKWVPLQCAVGKLAAEMIVPYPPGIPLVVKGQRMTKEIVDVIENLIWNRVYLQGIREQHVYIFE